ncbi:MAG: hypothetical protein IH984_03340 [Planctomycetes bacterium]|nr:hypothetical protein [Planctomycetota bacterium]
MVEIPEELKAMLKRKRNGKLEPIYVKDGDCVIFYSDERRCHADRVNDLVTIYLADDDESLVGCKIKDIGLTLQRYGSFGVAVVKKDVLLGFLFSLVGVKPEDHGSELFESPIAQQKVRLPEELVTC